MDSQKQKMVADAIKYYIMGAVKNSNYKTPQEASDSLENAVMVAAKGVAELIVNGFGGDIDSAFTGFVSKTELQTEVKS